MKKTFFLFAVLLTAGLTSFAQTVINPVVETQEDKSSKIVKIETNNKFTIVSFEQNGFMDGWVQINKEIFIQTNVDNKHYNMVKAENIPVMPGKHTFAQDNEKLYFKLYFEKIPSTAKYIYIIERAGASKNGTTYFNFYNVSLSDSQTDLPINKTKVLVTDVVLTPPPPMVKNMGMASGNEMSNIFNSMGPLFGNMTKSIMDAQLEYYKQPQKVTEVAKLQKQYFEALVKEGFTQDQALKILTTESLLPKPGMTGK